MLSARLHRLVFFASIGGATLLAIACGSSADDLRGAPSGTGSSGSSSGATEADDGGGNGDGINTTGVGAGTGANTGLPCNVQQLLENRCIGCHLAASPPPLLTYDDLLKPAPSNPAKNLAQVSLERMKDTARPMPPKPAEAPTADEIATLEGWVNASTPKGMACTSVTDGGVEGGSTSNPYNTPTVCTSNQRWTGGNRESPNMRPGGTCITCHSMRGGPAYTIAGTVYPTAHEPNDCNGGASGTLKVVVTDANQKVTEISVNGVGNFYSRVNLAAPFFVKVTNGTKERVMAGSLTAGDCNTCHTETGTNGAPGRIMAP